MVNADFHIIFVKKHMVFNPKEDEPDMLLRSYYP